MHDTQIEVDGETYPFVLDYDAHTWTSTASFEEAEFPVTTEIAGRRYELYSDGTFAEVEV
ncbi:MAG TPA: hypothetical protein VHT05_15645 [Candidatus Elarobacter sp.]|jgi:hypothetical protein|nr:hypothetical protein [Candidatus Elarobacter sp.]